MKKFTQLHAATLSHPSDLNAIYPPLPSLRKTPPPISLESGADPFWPA